MSPHRRVGPLCVCTVLTVLQVVFVDLDNATFENLEACSVELPGRYQVAYSGANGGAASGASAV